jgi:hypothetical protein
MQRFWFIFLVFILNSCSQNHFEKEIRFENNNWNKFNELELNIPIEAGETYDFFGNIYTDSTFNRRKLELGFYLYFPGGEKRLSDLNFRILDFEYQPTGEKTELGFKKSIAFKENIQSEQSGNLRLKIVQHSQYYDNFGIIGLDLFVKEK